MRRRLALAALSGALTFAAFPGVGAWPLAFVCWAPLLLALEGVSLRRAALLGFVSGLAATLPAFRFLYPTLRAESGFGPLACAFFVLLIAAYHALRGLVVGLIARADAPPSPTAAASAFTSLAPSPEPAAAPRSPTAIPSARPGPPSVLFVAGLIASELAIPSLFPWYFGASVHDIPLFLQTAELAGPIAVSAILSLSSLALAETLSALRAERRTRPRVIVPALLLPIVAAFWGSLRIPEIDARAREADPLTVGIVQPNLARVDEPVAVARLRDASADLAARGADLLLWPEGAVPWVLPAPLIEPAFATIRAPAIPVLTGALVHGATPELTPTAAPPGPADAPNPPHTVSRTTNSALLFQAGRLTARYDKHHLLPFSESLPLEATFPWLRDLSPRSGRFAPGEGLSPLPFGNHTLAVFICYEDLFPAHVRALTASGRADLLVNLTNDSWFEGTDEPRVHLALAKLRAVEQRKYLVRSTLSGHSAVIDPAGRTLAALGEDREGTLLARVHFLPGKTLYAHLGDAPLWLLVAGLLAYTLWNRRSRPIAPEPERPS